MIGFFPDPYPDELFYSICARFQKIVQYPGCKSAIEELFGTGIQTVGVFIPNHLDRLISCLPNGHKYTVEQLISEHTLLPFFSPFMEQERVFLIKENMRGDTGNLAQMRLGMLSTKIRFTEWLNFCPMCAEEDIKQFGECYWHRLHQLPGVKVCHIHKVFLENSTVRTHSKKLRYELIPAEQVVTLKPPQLIDSSNPSHKVLLKISYDAAWLLNNSDLVGGKTFIQNRYLYLLKKMNLATNKMVSHIYKLLNFFKNYYNCDVLKLLDCEIAEVQQNNWLFCLVRPAIKWSQPPLYHLLMIQFLGYTAEEFFNLTEEKYRPFGEGPWPCLNSVSHHFQKLQILEVTCKERSNKVTGTFRCKDCGFIYTRIGADQSLEDQFRFNQVKSYGIVWEEALKQLWSDPTITFSEISRRLGGVNREVIKRKAVSLGLSFPRLGPHSQVTQGNKPTVYDSKNKHKLLTNKLDVSPSKQSSSQIKYPTSNLFGKSPWPCLNPVCEHFQQPQIQDITLTNKKDKITGIFHCICGFVYTKTGSEQSLEDRFRFNRVKSYGPKWENTLRQLWNDSSLTLSEIARQLGIEHSETVRRQALYLGLSFPRRGPVSKVIQPKRALLSNFEDSQMSTLNKLEIYRNEWLSARRDYPEEGRSFLSKKFGRIYSWLYKNDRLWLVDNFPPLKKVDKSIAASRIDWESRDYQLLEAVKLSALNLKNASERPVRITKTAVANNLGDMNLKQWLICSKKMLLSKLPLTAKALDEVVETKESFSIRKNFWDANRLL
ncbi:TnsD family Tn7-like transposition protein [Nostoc sp. DSM 114160]|jgi:hypothetical protein